MICCVSGGFTAWISAQGDPAWVNEFVVCNRLPRTNTNDEPNQDLLSKKV